MTLRPKKSYVQIPHEEFVAAWLRLGDVQAVADFFKISRGSAVMRANYLRKAGVKLPHKVRGNKPIDVDALNKLIEEGGKK